MKNNEKIGLYIRQKRSERKAQNIIYYREQFSLGVHSRSFSDLSSWKQLVSKKKNFILWIWIDTFVFSLLTILMLSGILEKFEPIRIDIIIQWLMFSSLAMLLYLISSYQSLFMKFRQVEREVRKLINQDILERLKKNDS